MTFGVNGKFEPIKEKDGTDITVSYTDIGTPLTNKARLVGIFSTVNQEIYISFSDGANHLRLKITNDERIFNFTANKVRPDGFFLKKGTQIQTKLVGTTVPTEGSVWVELVYGEQ